jgi:predicted transcriptional regulator YheO
VVRETGKTVDNGFEEVYVNTKIKDGSEVSELMEVFVTDDAYNSKFPKTSDGKRRYKETESGVNTMCEIMERLTTEARDEGLNEGIAKGKLEILYNLVQDGVLTLKDAANRANMTEVIFTEKTKQFKA